LRHLGVELRFGEGIGEANGTEATIAIAAQDTQTSPIAGMDLSGSDKQWNPISTAPMEENLEVRVEDSFGRYVLLFPCRLLRGEGWINGWLETPLTAVPVDWRKWDEASIHF
jgi:hypothetical protein